MLVCRQEKIKLKLIVLAVSAACSVQMVQAQEAAIKDKDGKLIQQVEIAARADQAGSSAKSKAPLRDLPVSVSIVPAEVLQDQGALSLDAAIKNVSGLTQSSTNNYGYFNNYLARGLPVNYVRDGMPDGPAVNGYARTLTDVQQIEVLKGPGSAMYGAGMPGGFVNLISKKPEATAAHSVEVGGGSFNARRVKFDSTGAIDDSAQYRLIAAYSNTDGYRGYGNKTTEILPSFSVKFDRDQTTNITIRHIDSLIHNDSVGMIFRNHQIVNVPQTNRYYTPFSEGGNKIDQVSVKHEINLNSEWLLRADLSYANRDLDFKRNVPNWRLSETATGTQMVNRNWRDQQDRLHDSLAQVEAVWNTAMGSMKHEVLFGAGWSQTKGTAMRKQALLAPITDIYAPVFPEKANADLDEAFMWNRQVKSAQSGVYVQDQMSLNKEWKLRAGLRADRYTISDQGQYNSWFDAGGAFTSGLAANKESFVSKPANLKNEVADLASSKLNSSLGAVYQPSANTSYYIGAATGSFSNFTTEMGRTAFAPETSRQFEIGNKSVMMNGMFATNVAVYDNRRLDYFQTANGLTGSLGSAKTRGLDAELIARPMRGLQMRLAYAYQDAAYTKYVDVVSKKNDANVVGKQVAGTSKNQMNLWATYDLQSAEWKGFGVGAGVSCRDAFYADVANTNLAPKSHILDAVAYYRGAGFEVQANLSNLTNQRWYRYAAGDNSAAPGDARALNVSARFKF